MTTVDVNPLILRWAQHRSGHSDTKMRTRFPTWDSWIQQKVKPTFSQLEMLAEYTHVPFGYFFLAKPPNEELPSLEASSNLLDTFYLNQRRQDWYVEYLTTMEIPNSLSFTDSAKNMDVATAAALITQALSYDMPHRPIPSVDSRSHLIAQWERLGGLVVFSSMVGNDTTRMLDLAEFRGFTLQSHIAPLIFINSCDTVTCQIFSFLRECAHVWHGDDSGIITSGAPFSNPSNAIEHWCDDVATEIAVPATDLHNNFNPHVNLTLELDRLSHRYHCPTSIILRKLRATGLITFHKTNNIKDDNNRDYHHHLSERLVSAIIRNTQLGITPMTEALRLLEFGSIPEFDTAAATFGRHKA